MVESDIYEPKYAVTRIKRDTLIRIRNLADEYDISAPKMLDKMLDYFEMIKPVIDTKAGKDGQETSKE